MRTRVSLVVAVALAFSALAVAGAVHARPPVVRTVSFPGEAVVSTPWSVTISVTPSGRGTLRATGPGTLTAPLVATKRKATFRATLRFPRAGVWIVSSRVGPRTTRLGSVVVDVSRDPLLAAPVTIAAEPAGTLAVGQRSGASLVRLTDGRASAIASGPGLEHVTSANGSLYGIGSDGVVYRADGSSLTPVSPALDASSAAVDAAGNIYVTVYAGWIKRITPGGAVTTIAGNGTEGSSGDGGPASAALLFHPHAIVLSENALYVSDTENRRLRRIDLVSGIITTFGGNVGVTVALATGPDGSLYSADVIRDGGGGGITRTTPDGVTTRLLNGVDVNGIAVTPNGAIFANLWNEKRIQHFNPTTNRLDPVARG